jgi:hypothetical protein
MLICCSHKPVTAQLSGLRNSKGYLDQLRIAQEDLEGVFPVWAIWRKEN